MPKLSDENFVPFNPENYEKETFRNQGGSFISRMEISGIRSKLSISTDSTILEVGMGPGRIMAALGKSVGTLVGLDRDRKMIRHFKSSCLRKNVQTGNFHFVVADGQNLPFRKNSFDSVLCIRVLKYFQSPISGLSEMSYVLKHSGNMCVEFTNFLSLSMLPQLGQLLRKGEFYPRLFRLGEIRKMIKSSNLTINGIYAWHKIPNKVWNLIRDASIVRILFLSETILQRITPKDFLSKSIIVVASRQ